MKKLFLTMTLSLVVCLSFAQKKAVSSAKDEIKGKTPNITEARSLIKEALKHPETAELAETWFVAGKVEDAQFNVESAKDLMGLKANESVMYQALQGIIPYFLKATELDRRPDEKGNIKPKFIKDIKSMIRANRPYYVNAGIYYYENEDYKKAYDNFKLYLDIPNMDIFDASEWVIIPNDTNDLKIEYYAGFMATLIPDHKAAIEIFSRIKDKDISNSNEIYQRLCNEYDQIKDSVSFSKLIKEGFLKFPGEEYYILNLINLNLTSGNTDDAVGYLKTAIEQSPKNEQLYDVLGQVYEAGKDNENAIQTLQKALAINPDYMDALTHLGRVYFNLGVETRSAADDITNVAKSKEESQKALNYFKQALPYFEKAFSIDAKNKDSIYALRSIYYNLGMEPEYLKMDAIYSDESNDD